MAAHEGDGPLARGVEADGVEEVLDEAKARGGRGLVGGAPEGGEEGEGEGGGLGEGEGVFFAMGGEEELKEAAEGGGVAEEASLAGGGEAGDGGGVAWVR